MKLFATRVWGFGFARLPLATFGVKGNLGRLLTLAKRGDRLMFVGTQTERTAPEHQGRILGMAEIGFEPLRTLDLVEREALDPRDFDAAGNFKFPHAVATTRVWQFEPAPVLTQLLSRQLTMVARGSHKAGRRMTSTLVSGGLRSRTARGAGWAPRAPGITPPARSVGASIHQTAVSGDWC